MRPKYVQDNVASSIHDKKGTSLGATQSDISNKMAENENSIIFLHRNQILNKRISAKAHI